MPKFSLHQIQSVFPVPPLFYKLGSDQKFVVLGFNLPAVRNVFETYACCPGEAVSAFSSRELV